MCWSFILLSSVFTSKRHYRILSHITIDMINE